jgi:hypothetical protein
MMKCQVTKRKLYSLFIALFSLTAGSLLFSSCYYDNEEYLYPTTGQSNCDTINVTYNAAIAPIFADNCNGCHNSSSPGGNVITDNHDDLVTNIDKVWNSINHIGSFPMPKDGNKLSDCNIAKINRWRNLGMPNN